MTEDRTGAARYSRFVRELVATAGRPAGLALVLALSVAASEAVGLLLLFPLLDVAGVSVGDGAAGDLGRAVQARLAHAGLPAGLAPLLALYAAAMAGRALLQRLYAIQCMRLREEFLFAQRRRLHRAMLASRWEQVAGQREGSLTHSLTGELERMADAPFHLLDIVAGALIGSVYVSLAVRLSVGTTVLAAACGVALLVILRPRRVAARRAGQAVHDQTADLFAAAAEHVAGIKTAKGLGAEARSHAVLAERSIRVADARIRCETLFADARALLDVGALAVLAVAIYVAGGVLRLGPAAILVLLYVFARFTPRLAALQSAYQRLALAMPAFSRSMQALDRWEAAAERGAGDGLPLRLDDGLTLRAVEYRYRVSDADADRPDADDQRPRRPAALRGVTLAIAAGRTTAIVGPSGAGKSTLADLVLGYIFPDAGRVEVDGIELTPGRARAWRRQVGFVAQDTFLFDDTIAANLRWARPDATEADMFDALTHAAAADFVAALPDGLSTVVGERGLRLSGGERQRLALARALLRRPAMLVLDEATSNVDAENERRIQQAVESLHGRMTVLVITHRLATIRSADAIYVMDGGRVVEGGSWLGLVRANGRFTALCRAQGLIPVGQSDMQARGERAPVALEPA